jgi:hypothetical protein
MADRNLAPAGQRVEVKAVVRSEVNFEFKSVCIFWEINWGIIVNGICHRPTFHSFAPMRQEFTSTSHATDPLARWAKEISIVSKGFVGTLFVWIHFFYIMK